MKILKFQAMFPPFSWMLFWAVDHLTPEKNNPTFALINRIEKRIQERKKFIVGKGSNIPEHQDENGTEAVPQDFITLFLNAEATEENDTEALQNLKLDTSGLASFKNATINKRMTPKVQHWPYYESFSQEICTNLFLFMLAGFETTSNALAFLTHLIVTHPDVQRKAQEEIDRVADLCVGQSICM